MSHTDWIARTPHGLAAQIRQLVTALSTPEGMAASGVSEAQLTALTEIATQIETNVASEEQLRVSLSAAIATTKASADTGEDLLRAVGRQANNHAEMTDAIRKLAGLTVAEQTSSGNGPLPIVLGLEIIARPSGDNFIDWQGITGANIAYDVYTRLYPTDPWLLVGYTFKTEYLHVGAGAGVRREYYVVGRRGERLGEPSPRIAVY